ncbi:unnamed protein product [Prunus armeniaca]
MLAKLGYESGQYNPNFWILLHGYILLGGLRDWGSQRLSSSCIYIQFLGNRETLAECKPIVEKQKRKVTSLVICLLLGNLGGTGSMKCAYLKGKGRRGWEGEIAAIGD